MAKVKCTYCHTEIDKKDALAIPNGKRNKYYCCLEHVGLANERDIFYQQAQDVIGKTTSSVFYKEMNEIAQVHGFNKMCQYLKVNELYLKNAMHKSFKTEFGKIRYFAAILKNNLGNFKYIKPVESKEVKPPEIYKANYKRKNERRGMNDLLDDIISDDE